MESLSLLSSIWRYPFTPQSSNTVNCEFFSSKLISKPWDLVIILWWIVVVFFCCCCCCFCYKWASLGLQGIKWVNPEGNQPWIFVGRTDAEAEAAMLWPPGAKSQLTGKDSDAGKDWGQENEVTEDEMVEWYHRPNGHEFEQTLGDGEGQGGLQCCSPRGRRQSARNEDWTTTNSFMC